MYDEWFHCMNQRQKEDCSSNYYHSFFRKMVYSWIARHVSNILEISLDVSNILVIVLIVRVFLDSNNRHHTIVLLILEL